MSAWETCNLIISAVERCRTMPERREMIYSPTFQRSQELFRGRTPEGTAVNKAKHTWEFPNGSTLHFGYGSDEGDAERYLNEEFAAIEFDGSLSWNARDLLQLCVKVRR